MKTKAFTLIELAISLTIIGLLIGGSFQAMKAMREKTEITEAKESVKAASDAVIGFAMQDGYLPNSSDFTNNLSLAKGTENKLFYKYDNNLINDICAFDSTELEVIDNSQTPPKSFKNIAFVIASASANHNMQTELKTSTTSNEVHIYAPSKEVDDNTTPINRAFDRYDDVVKYVTLNELKQLVDCSEKKLRILNDHNLLDGISTLPYGGSDIYADKGMPFPDGDDSDDEEDYQWCVESSEATAFDDWLEIECDGNLPIETDCRSTTAQYKQCTTLKLEGITNENATKGIHKIKIFVKDRANNPINKSFTIKINEG